MRSPHSFIGPKIPCSPFGVLCSTVTHRKPSARAIAALDGSTSRCTSVGSRIAARSRRSPQRLMFDESEPLGSSSGAQMGGAAVLDEGASIVLVAHSRRRIKKKAAHTPEVRDPRVSCAMCCVLLSCLGHNLATWFFYYVPREHTNVLHARSSLGAAAPGAAGVRIPPPSEVRAGAGEGQGGRRGTGLVGEAGLSRRRRGLHARLRAALAPQLLLTRFFLFHDDTTCDASMFGLALTPSRLQCDALKQAVGRGCSSLRGR